MHYKLKQQSLYSGIFRNSAIRTATHSWLLLSSEIKFYFILRNMFEVCYFHLNNFLRNNKKKWKKNIYECIDPKNKYWNRNNIAKKNCYEMIQLRFCINYYNGKAYSCLVCGTQLNSADSSEVHTFGALKRMVFHFRFSLMK